MEKEIEDKFIALETKIAYMDDFITKLQEEAVENQKMIHLLREENRQAAHQQAICNANRADDFIVAEGPGVCKKKHGK